MPGKLTNNLEFQNNQAIDMLLQIIAGDHGNPVEGKIYYDSIAKKAVYYNGSALIRLTIPSDLASYITASSAEALSNKSIDADNNTISNLEVDNLKAGVLDVDLNSVSASDDTLASAKAIKAYVDAQVSAASSGMSIQGGIDCSANPNYPAADKGHVYHVTVDGKIGGASGPQVRVGDALFCTVDSSASGDHATVGGNWFIVEKNTDLATTELAGYVELATQSEAEARISTTLAVPPSALKNYGQVKTFDIGDNAATEFTLNHGFNTLNVIVQVRENAAPYEEISCKVQRVDVNNVKIIISNPVAQTAEFKAIIIGPKG